MTSGNITSGPLKEGKQACIMNGVGVKNRISQNVLINKSGEQTYIISGWVQANGAVYNEERNYVF